LPGSFDEYFKTLKPNFRTEVRRGERRLREIGDVTSKIFTTVADVDQLWGAVCSIERESWKEAAGTSITTNSSQEIFYREFLPRGAAAGQLFSPVLYLDGRPIAHKICLVRDGVAAILKMSYVDDLKRYYPSTVLLAAYFQEVIARGTRFLDFMGVCDDFKMRWTNLTYGRTKYTIYRRTLAGRLDYTRHRIARRLGYVRGRFRGQSAAIDNG
jgi:CelD/BcsL family acetyltransferase involved in cellulose biosynthesis